LQRRANVEAAVTGLIAALVVFFIGCGSRSGSCSWRWWLSSEQPRSRREAYGQLAVLLAVAASVGVLIAVRRRPAPQQAEPYRVLAMRATAAVTTTAILIGGWLGGWWAAEQRQEPDYLDAFADTSLRTTEDEVLLTAGHRAFDWLQGKRWGTPPDGPEDIVHTGDWNYSPVTSSHSTQRLLASYASEVGSRDLATSTDERLLILAAEPAWHRLCVGRRFDSDRRLAPDLRRCRVNAGTPV